MNARDLPGMGDRATFPFGVTEREDDDVSREVAIQNIVSDWMDDLREISEMPGWFSVEEDQAIARATKKAFQATAWDTEPCAELLEEIGRARYRAVMRAMKDAAAGRIGK